MIGRRSFPFEMVPFQSGDMLIVRGCSSNWLTHVFACLVDAKTCNEWKKDMFGIVGGDFKLKVFLLEDSTETAVVKEWKPASNKECCFLILYLEKLFQLFQDVPGSIVKYCVHSLLKCFDLGEFDRMLQVGDGIKPDSAEASLLWNCQAIPSKSHKPG